MRFASITLDLLRAAAGPTLVGDGNVRRVKRDHGDSHE
jgi:hypothetical protein